VARRLATKQKDIWQASQGFPATPTILQVLLSEGFHKKRLTLQRISQLLARDPARIFNISDRKGSIFVGADADLTVVDVNLEKKVRASDFVSHADYSLYDGWKLKGWPVMTLVRGEVVMQDGKLLGRQGYGRFMPRRLGKRSEGAR